MNWVTIKRVFRAGFLDFWRNAFVSFSSILAMTEALFVLGLVIFAGVMLNSTLSELRDKADMSVIFTLGAPEEQILSLKSSLEAMPEVAEVVYSSREEELAAFREEFKDDQLALQALDELGQNPFGAKLTIEARDVGQYSAIAETLTEKAALSTDAPSIIDKVNYYDPRYNAALTRLQNIIDAAQRIGFVLIGLFILTTLTICFNLVRLAIYNSRDEIHVMRLVGAGAFYIRAPFMVEGLLQGAVAGVLTLLLFYPLTYWLGEATGNFFGSINVFSYYLSNFPLFFLVFIGGGLLLGATFNFLAVRRYLKI